MSTATDKKLNVLFKWSLLMFHIWVQSISRQTMFQPKECYKILHNYQQTRVEWNLLIMYIGTAYSMFKNVHIGFKCMPLRNTLWEEYKVVPTDTRLSGV